jgi:hypothetical protein
MSSSWETAYLVVGTLGVVFATFVFISPMQLFVEVFRKRKAWFKRKAYEGKGEEIGGGKEEEIEGGRGGEVTTQTEEQTNKTTKTGEVASGSKEDGNGDAKNGNDTDNDQTVPPELEIPPLAVTAQTIQCWLWLVFGIVIADSPIIIANCIGLFLGVFIYLPYYPFVWKTIAVATPTLENTSPISTPGRRHPIYKQQFWGQMFFSLVLLLGSSVVLFLDRSNSVVLATMESEANQSDNSDSGNASNANSNNGNNANNANSNNANNASSNTASDDIPTNYTGFDYGIEAVATTALVLGIIFVAHPLFIMLQVRGEWGELLLLD